MMGGVTGNTDYITFDELEALGCPRDLLMQYLGWTHAEVLDLLMKTTPAKELISLILKGSADV